ncbi:hypothetical protein ES703_123332 [subsurface metagenome]
MQGLHNADYLRQNTGDDDGESHYYPTAEDDEDDEDDKRAWYTPGFSNVHDGVQEVGKEHGEEKGNQDSAQSDESPGDEDDGEDHDDGLGDFTGYHGIGDIEQEEVSQRRNHHLPGAIEESSQDRKGGYEDKKFPPEGTVIWFLVGFGL